MMHELVKTQKHGQLMLKSVKFFARFFWTTEVFGLWHIAPKSCLRYFSIVCKNCCDTILRSVGRFRLQLFGESSCHRQHHLGAFSEVLVCRFRLSDLSCLTCETCRSGQGMWSSYFHSWTCTSFRLNFLWCSHGSISERAAGRGTLCSCTTSARQMFFPSAVAAQVSCLGELGLDTERTQEIL